MAHRLAEAEAHQAAVDEVLRVMTEAPADVSVVMSAIARGAAQLCNAPFVRVTVLRDGLLHPLAAYAVDGNTPPAHAVPVCRTSIQGRALVDRTTLHYADIVPLLETEFPDAIENARILGFRAVLAVPLVYGEEGLGAIFVHRRVPGLFEPSQVTLVETFAREAAIALRTVRQHHATQEALEQQAASNAVLRTISRARFDLSAVLQTLIESATRLCDADKGTITREQDGQFYRAESYGFSREFADYVRAVPVALDRNSATGRALVDRQIVHIADTSADPEYRFEEARRLDEFRSILSVPLLRDGAPLGVISVTRTTVRPFTPRQIELLSAFADQAVIAIENVRLFTQLDSRNRDLTEALEQQTATSDILRVISQSPTNVQPVFDTIATAAQTLCDASSANVFTFDGDLIHMVALANFDSAAAAAMRSVFPRRPGRDTAVTRAIQACSVVAIADVLDDAEYAIGAAAIAGGFRSTVCVPLIREGKPIGAISVGRAHPGPFPANQIALLQTFADQAVIAIENGRLFNELQARNRDLTEALEHQTATSEILRVIARSPSDVGPVFDTIGQRAAALCEADIAVVSHVEGEMLHLVSLHGIDEIATSSVAKYFPMRLDAETTSARAVRMRSVINVPDVLADPLYLAKDAAIRANWRAAAAVPMFRHGDVIGAIFVGRKMPGLLPSPKVELLKTFADQAVIAIENVRLFNELQARNRELTESLDQQTATGEILQVISRSHTDPQPVFEAIVRNAARLCDGMFANLVRFDGEALHFITTSNQEPAFLERLKAIYPTRPDATQVAGRVVLSKSTVVMEDALADALYPRDVALAGRWRRMLGVPMMRGQSPIGVILVGWEEPGPVPKIYQDLLQTFADQAVIAVENVRLFTELEARNRDLIEALEQQTATSDILRVISQSQTDVQPVFNTIVNSVLALCNAAFSGVYLLDRETLSLAATAGMTEEARTTFSRGYPRRIGADTVSGLAALECRIVQTDDIMSDPTYAGAPGTYVGARTVLAVPLLRDGRAIGSIGVWRAEVLPFTETQVALLQTFADQAVIAIENVRLFKELQTQTVALTRSVDEMRALGEVGQAVSSTLDLGTVLSTIVARAAKLVGVDAGSIYEYDAAREEFELHSSYGLPDEFLEAFRATPMRKGEGALGRMALTREPVEIHDVADTAAYQSRVRDTLLHLGYRSVLVVPLLREDHLLGGLAVNRKTPGAFDPQVVELLKTFATQSAIAIQNARLFREIEIKSRELEAASRHKSEFLANMSHELRTPLNAIIGFSEVLGERLFGELNDKQAEYVSDIADSGRHLLDLINDILDLSKIEAGRMELDAADFDLPRAIEQTLSLVRERAERHGIALRAQFDPEVAAVRADQRKVKQVLLNLLSNALKFTPQGGSVEVEARSFDDRVEVSVKDTGVGIAPEDHEAVFEEFRQVGANAAKAGGTGLGLAISRRFIELHGGRLWLASDIGKGSTFTFSLPR